MDDFNAKTLHEAKNEWIVRLLNLLTPLIIEGFRSIFNESYKLCKDNKEMDKYLMTFQNFITRIPKWNSVIVDNERERIVEKSRCTYLEELVTCVHIIQLKLLTAMRVGRKQRKIDIQIPKLGDFIHKCYIQTAKKIYTNVYLFDVSVAPMQQQKNARELEMLVRECIMNTVRDSIPVETILRAYMDETVEDDVVEEIIEQPVYEDAKLEASKEMAEQEKEREEREMEEKEREKEREREREEKEREEREREERERLNQEISAHVVGGGSSGSGSIEMDGGGGGEQMGMTTVSVLDDDDNLPPLDIMSIRSLSNDGQDVDLDLDLPMIELDD